MTYRARMEEGAPRPDFLAGHSLGEYNALLAAGVLDFSTGLRLVQERGRIMSRVGGGGMAAVIGLEPARIEAVLGASESGRTLDVANFNSFEQTVIAGPNGALEAVRPDIKAAGGKIIPLNVSAPFHSRYMRGPQAEFQTVLAAAPLRPPLIAVVSNATARPYEASALHDTLGRQIGQSVRWLDSMLFLLDAGVDQFEEVGPGKVLARLVDQIRRRRDAPRA
jgi:malonyl CoA-acyl carrier protein transacylase